MDERRKAGLKAGGLCGICTIILKFVEFGFLTSDIIYVIGGVGCILYFMPGILSIYFGKHVIKSGKDALMSILVAVTVFSIIFVIVSGVWVSWSPLFFVATFIPVFLFTNAMSSISGVIYAKYILGMSLQ
ncbi:MAG: hypothetical protein HXS44_12165 [Theionarchaea archaeon]|nr:hypothetical protein [Theionarchaea archaeon]